MFVLRGGLGRFHLLAVFAESCLAVAPGAMMKRALRVRDIRGIAFPRFEHGRL